MSDNVVTFQTLEEQIQHQIYRNLEASDGKDRSYFDVMRGVGNEHSDFANTILTRLIREGVIRKRETTTFLHNRAQTLTYYRASIPMLLDRIETL